MDTDTNLRYFNARWYDPNLGRFITEDPIKSGNNWYIYCSNNPLNRIDFNGLEDKKAWLIEYFQEHSLNHTAVQTAMSEKVGGANLEYPVKGSGPNGGTGRADVVKLTDPIKGKGYVWEVKPDNAYWNEYSNVSEKGIGQGRKQNKRYIDNSDGKLKPGFPVPDFSIPHPTDPEKEIFVRSGDPSKAVGQDKELEKSMLYYTVRDKERQEQRQTQTSSVPLSEAERELQRAYNNLGIELTAEDIGKVTIPLIIGYVLKRAADRFLIFANPGAASLMLVPPEVVDPEWHEEDSGLPML